MTTLRDLQLEDIELSVKGHEMVSWSSDLSVELLIEELKLMAAQSKESLDDSNLGKGFGSDVDYKFVESMSAHLSEEFHFNDAEIDQFLQVAQGIDGVKDLVKAAEAKELDLIAYSVSTDRDDEFSVGRLEELVAKFNEDHFLRSSEAIDPTLLRNIEIASQFLEEQNRASVHSDSVAAQEIEDFFVIEDRE